jgi:hypothetical protein
MKLISMVDFVLADKYAGSPINTNKKYANFLKQPLELWMFVPCDDDGNVLEEIKPYQDNYFKYQQAKERCLFDGFEFEKQKDYYIITLNGNGLWVSWNKSKKIENLIEFNLQLTPTALKQIGL